MKIFAQFSLIQGVVVPVLALLLMVWMGVPISVTVVGIIAVVLQSVFGIVFITYIQPNAAREYQLAVGAVVGVLISILVDVLLFELTGVEFGWLIPFACLCATAIVSSRIALASQIAMLTEPKPALLGFLAVVSLFLLSRDFGWILLPSLIGLGALLVFRDNRRWLPVGSLVVAGAGFFTTTSRAEFWWFLTDDLQVFESVSFHFLKYGSGDVLGPLGELGGRYHVLTYQWTGLLSQLSGAGPYVVLNRVAPALLAIALAGLIWGFLASQSTLAFGTKLMIAFLFPLLINYSFVSPSYAAGVVVLLAAFRFWTTNLQRHVMFSSAISFILGLSLALIKSSNIPVVVFGLAALVLWSWSKCREQLRVHLADLLGAYASLGLYAVLFLFNDRTTRQLDSFQLFGYAKQVLSEIDSLSDRPLRAVAALLVSAGLLALPCAVGLWIWKSRKWSTVSVFAVAQLPFALLMTVASGNQANGYFISSALNILFLYSLMIVGSLVESGMNSTNRRKMLSLLAATSLACSLVWVISRQFNGGTTAEIWLRVAENSALPAVFFGATLAVALGRGSDVRTVVNGGVVSLVVLLVFSSTATREVLVIQRLDKGPELTAQDAVQAVGPAAERDIIIQVRERIPPEAVLATNRFCGEQCRGGKWFERDLSTLRDDFNLPPTISGFGGNNFRLSAESRRRVLIEGPRWLIVNGYPVDEARKRVQASLDFAEYGSAEARQALRELGVTHFVLHLPSRASTIPIGSYGRVVASNDEYLVFRLG